MDIEAIQKAQILRMLVEDTPLAFWEEFGSTAKALYSGVFQEIAEDPNFYTAQKPSMLWQQRHFRMEALIAQVAAKKGVPFSAEQILTNRCAYIYVCAGRIAMTQSYVPETGKLPRPSKFRQVHAGMNEFSRAPQLALGDKIIEISEPKQVNGILIHSPVGHKFNEESQKLGALGFYVPRHDYSEWAVNLSLTEIMAAYKSVPKRVDRAIPQWKDDKAGSGRKSN